MNLRFSPSNQPANRGSLGRCPICSEWVAPIAGGPAPAELVEHQLNPRCGHATSLSYLDAMNTHLFTKLLKIKQAHSTIFTQQFGNYLKTKALKILLSYA